MTWNDVAENWAAFSAAITQRWPFIDETALQRIGGDYSLFVAELAKPDGGSIEAAQEQIDIWLRSGIPADIISAQYGENDVAAPMGSPETDAEILLNDESLLGETRIAKR
jgi:hypothetical protein